jgi:hypothetical protein
LGNPEWVWVTRNGLRVWVPPGIGTGYDIPTRELSNESKNIIFGPKLKELQLILQNLSKLAVSPSILGQFGHFWTLFDG